MNTLEKRAIVRSILNAQNGKFFTVTLNSKAGQRIIKMNGRTGVKKYLKGGKSTTEHCQDLLTMFAVDRMAYRSVFLDGVTRIAAENKVWTF